MLTSGATSGSLTASTSATDYKATAPLTQAIDGQTYTFSETSSTNSLGHYSAAYVCVDSTGGSANVTGTGTSTTPITVHDGQTWVCTFTNTANAHSAPVVELKKFVPNGLWNAGDVFAISVEDSAAAVVAGPTDTVQPGASPSTAPWADITVPGATAQTYTFVETGPAGFTSNYVITPACVDGSGATVSISALSATSFQANAALDAKLVCSFTNTANTPPVPPVLGAHKLVSSVYSSSDQFGLRVTDPSNVVLTSGATSGSLTASTSAH